MSDVNLDKAKVMLRNYFCCYYNERGLEPTRQRMLDYLKAMQEDAKQCGIPQHGGTLRGELCEIYLELCLKDYVLAHENTFVIKGLCFDKADGSGYTEMDLTLFTPAQIIFFECKSYSGKKTLTDECTIVRDKFKPMNVYAQSKMHVMNFLPLVKSASMQISRSKTLTNKPMKIVYFGLSLDPTEDKRTPEMKKRVPYTSDENILEYLQSVSELNTVQWNIEKLYRIVSKLNTTSDEKFKKHLINMQSK